MKNTKLVFSDWLEKQGIKFDDFIKNCEVKNQRWPLGKLYYTDIVAFISRTSPRDWLTNTFNWSKSSYADEATWARLDTAWREIVSTVKVENVMFDRLVFLDWLEENGIKSEDFLVNCLTENQQWDSKDSYYDDISYLKSLDPFKWLELAFNWQCASIDGVISLTKLNDKWYELVAYAKSNGKTISFSQTD